VAERRITLLRLNATKSDVIRSLLFHHLEKNLTLQHSIRCTIEELFVIWRMARIPHQHSGEKKLIKLYSTYQLLKKNRAKALESYRIKEQLFKGELLELFDLSTKDAMETMTNEEDKQFLAMQREDVASSSMTGVDRKQAEKEAKKIARDKATDRRKPKAPATLQQEAAWGSSLAISTDSSTSEDTDDDEEFKVASLSTTPRSVQKPKCLKTVVSHP